MEKLTPFREGIAGVMSGKEPGIWFRSRELKKFKPCLTEIGDEDYKEVKDFLLVCVQSKDDDVMMFATAIMERRKLVKWKEHKDVFMDIMNSMLRYSRIINIEKEDAKAEVCYQYFMEAFVNLLNAMQMLSDPEIQNKLFEMIFAALSYTHNRLLETVPKFAAHLPWNEYTEKALKVFSMAYNVISKDPEMSQRERIALCIYNSVSSIYGHCFQNVNQAIKYVKHVAKIFNFCKNQEFMSPDDSRFKTISSVILKITIDTYLLPHHGRKEIMKPMFAALNELWECDDPDLRRSANYLITIIPGTMLAEMDEEKNTTAAVIESFINGGQKNVLANFPEMFRASPDSFDAYIDQIAEASENADQWSQLAIMTFFREVVKEYTSKITKKVVVYLIKMLQNEDTAIGTLLVLTSIAEEKPNMLRSYVQQLKQCMTKFKQTGGQVATIFGHMSKISEDLADSFMDLLSGMLSEKYSTEVKLSVLNTMIQIGRDYPKLLTKHEKQLKGLKDDSAYTATIQLALDVIHGRSLAGVAQDVQEAQQDIQHLDQRVTKTEDNVDELSKDVAVTKVTVAGLEKDVVRHEGRLDELEDVVEETVEKVEEIDKKTLSHAPTWSKDVARLLNQKADHDWRLLSSKLGYSNDDIRNWATQPDPCLSMFDEWFATHKTREATHAILKHLEEMNRTDAALIVENALKQAEDVVEDEEEDYIIPPEVFISYQWGIQNEVKLLKKHLEMAGFESWMDIGQMGGGDKLFAKIDSGIRAAKVIICCVTEKYAKSPNCNREVNLSVNLGKPIIPLLMEKMSWPPAGSMGPIFGEYLFIRFFARSGEQSGDIRYWPVPKFQELLLQLRYSVVPNEEIITDPYENWQSPPEEVIVIKPKDNNNSTQSTVAVPSSQGNEEMPEVFISYQWGKQPQIKALYKKLTRDGYRCWLDILQMGGGDSLYDKIDKGIRNCKVVVSCVTEKYSYSANCRREVSLADALKKPVIPLLLEKIVWPPAGPMSMVFTQLLYIDFCKPDISVQNHWECSQMQDLISKINAQIPHMANHSIKSNDQPSPVSKQNQKSFDVEWGDDDELNQTEAKSSNNSRRLTTQQNNSQPVSPRKLPENQQNASLQSSSSNNAAQPNNEKSSSCTVL